MTKFVLILTTWYTLLSDPSGSWKYVQIFGWFDDESKCEQRAINEGKRAAEFSNHYEDKLRLMPMIDMTYVCIDDNEMADMIRKENEKYDD